MGVFRNNPRLRHTHTQDTRMSGSHTRTHEGGATYDVKPNGRPTRTALASANTRDHARTPANAVELYSYDSSVRSVDNYPTHTHM